MIRTTETRRARRLELFFLRVFVPPWLVFEVLRVTEGQASRRHLPRGPECLGQIWIVRCDLFGECRKLLVDSRQPRVVLLEVTFLLQVATKQSNLFHQFGQEDSELAFHLPDCR